ncbi:group II intron reverse transcriptase/maturase [Clostridium sp.]|uniref:group II intron reverse transcriptase/maturase n=1 Tax=Clostridium sp. TaxID=1506 RepID=UPI002A90BD9B|nr:group II intron reverse transcriptase/maturase [Clostridium sp.]MDY6011871.1 group II intron reverse transcriptase/maturase [Clostridium sp.]
MSNTIRKKKALRNNEYYDMQRVFDELYLLSSKGSKFTKLMDIIQSRNNILLAYRNIKNNKGSMTAGTDRKTILDIADYSLDMYVEKVQNLLNNYNPREIRRVYIPKKNGKLRPLGIPCMNDRIVQQCIKQVIEPILEAKFYEHSYGFRPERGCKDAIARCNFLINRGYYNYVIDVDIKGFFDNVNHGKLLKQLWTLGIRDKKLIIITSKILKSKVKGIGRMTKGTPQGGVLSPLLANVVLNELDWWVDSQWNGFPYKNNSRTQDLKIRMLKRTKLKDVRIVRYADDFKIFCKNYNTAKRMKYAVVSWLKERLDLDCNEDKTKITNLRKNYSEFLGIEFKAVNKGKRYVSRSRMTKSSKKKCKDNLKKDLKRIFKYRSTENVNKFNSTVLGIHHYYDMATLISIDLGRLDYDLRRTLHHKLNRFCKKVPTEKARFYKSYKGMVWCLNNVPFYPIYACKNKPPMCFNQNINRYTEEGRKLIHERLAEVNVDALKYLLKNPVRDESVEFNDNRLSLYCAQRGRCGISKKKLFPHDIIVHHIKPKEKGGSDKYQNLIILSKEMHKLVHATREETIDFYYKSYSWDNNKLKMLNKLRKSVGNLEIIH